MPAVQLVSNATANVTPTTAYAVPSGDKTWQADIAGTGEQSVVLTLFGCLDRVVSKPVELATMTLSGTTTAADGLASITSNWPYMYVAISSLSGTSATVNSYIFS